MTAKTKSKDFIRGLRLGDRYEHKCSVVSVVEGDTGGYGRRLRCSWDGATEKDADEWTLVFASGIVKNLKPTTKENVPD